MIDLKFDRVSKKYLIYQESDSQPASYSLLHKAKRFLGGWQDFWALRDLSFEVQRGEALGIIGNNGAGKSTILKLLYNITTPTSGEIRIRGRVTALIEVASGFHPDLTGRENVYLNGSLLGMRRREIARKLDSIIDFAGVSAFIDTPVKRYSSGMHLRLGFSIAAHLEPDILLLDEVLAVGDAQFQAKCIDRINQLKKDGKTIVFVSHNLAAVESLCDRVFLLQRGEICKSGSPHEVISEYERLLTEMPATAPDHLTSVAKSPDVEIVSVGLFNAEGRQVNMVSTGDAIRAELTYIAHKPIEDAVIELYFYSVFGNLHSHFSTDIEGQRLDLKPGKGIVEFTCPELLMGVAAFSVEASVRYRGSAFTEHIDHKRVAILNVRKGKPIHGLFYMPHSFKIKHDGPSG